MTHVAKIVEIIGSSDKGWEEAAQVALDEAKKTIHGITGLEVTDMTAKVDPNSGMISQYRASSENILWCRTLIETIMRSFSLPSSLSTSNFFYLILEEKM